MLDGAMAMAGATQKLKEGSSVLVLFESETARTLPECWASLPQKRCG